MKCQATFTTSATHIGIAQIFYKKKQFGEIREIIVDKTSRNVQLTTDEKEFSNALKKSGPG